MPKLVKVEKDGATGLVPEGALEHWKKKGYTPVPDGGSGQATASAAAAVDVVTDADAVVIDGVPVDPPADPTKTPEPVAGDGGTAAGSADDSDKDQQGGGGRGLLGRR